jgi:hypothetical protein
MAITKKTIKLKCYNNIFNEKVAAGAITPGHLVYLTSAGKVAVHNVAGGNAMPFFAFEDEYQGKGINDAFAADDPVQVWTAGRGDEVFAILKNGENAAIGSFLESAGNGELQVHVVDSTGDYFHKAIVAMALEAVDMSGSSAVDPSGRIKVVIC